MTVSKSFLDVFGDFYAFFLPLDGVGMRFWQLILIRSNASLRGPFLKQTFSVGWSVLRGDRSCSNLDDQILYIITVHTQHKALLYRFLSGPILSDKRWSLLKIG